MEQIIIQEKDFQKARKRIREAKRTQGSKAEIVFSSRDDELSRKILEKEPTDALLINLAGRKDRMKQRDSGLNQVLAKLAKKNNVAIGINLDEILHTKTPKEKLQILSRARQNIKLCNKNKVKMKFISTLASGEKKDFYDLKALGLVLGMPTWMIKDIT